MWISCLGALEKASDREYRIGIRLRELGSLAPQQRDLKEIATPFMLDLFRATEENVELVVRDGNEALCIETISGKHAVPTRTEIGGRLPLHATAVGTAILAHSSPRPLKDMCDGGLKRYTPYTLVEPGRLLAALRESRASGLSFSREEMSVGAVSAASPIIGPDGQLHGALGLVVKSSTKTDHLAPAVKTAALGVGRLLL